MVDWRKIQKQFFLAQSSSTVQLQRRKKYAWWIDLRYCKKGFTKRSFVIVGDTYHSAQAGVNPTGSASLHAWTSSTPPKSDFWALQWHKWKRMRFTELDNSFSSWSKGKLTISWSLRPKKCGWSTAWTDRSSWNILRNDHSEWGCNWQLVAPLTSQSFGYRHFYWARSSHWWVEGMKAIRYVGSMKQNNECIGTSALAFTYHIAPVW